MLDHPLNVRDIKRNSLFMEKQQVKEGVLGSITRAAFRRQRVCGVELCVGPSTSLLVCPSWKGRRPILWPLEFFDGRPPEGRVLVSLCFFSRTENEARHSEKALNLFRHHQGPEQVQVPLEVSNGHSESFAGESGSGPRLPGEQRQREIPMPSLGLQGRR